MALILSTGAKIELLKSGGGFIDTFDEGAILLFSGTPPTDPDNGIGTGNQLIATACVDPDNWTAASPSTNGISWNAPDSSGNVTPDDTIIAKATVAGTVRWFWLVRGVSGGDGTGASTTIARIQGTAAVGGGDLVLSSANFSVGTTNTANSITFRF